jgi:hypothetical protein
MLRRAVICVHARYLSRPARTSSSQKAPTSSPSNIKVDSKQKVDSSQRHKKIEGSGKWRWVVGGIIVYGAGVGASILFMGSDSKSTITNDVSHVTEEERRRVYDSGAAAYEKEVCSTEEWTGITAIRRQLVGRSIGRVLEVAAGTGVNLTRDFYPASCSVTCVDCR